MVCGTKPAAAACVEMCPMKTGRGRGLDTENSISARHNPPLVSVWMGTGKAGFGRWEDHFYLNLLPVGIFFVSSPSTLSFIDHKQLPRLRQEHQIIPFAAIWAHPYPTQDQRPINALNSPTASLTAPALSSSAAASSRPLFSPGSHHGAMLFASLANQRSLCHSFSPTPLNGVATPNSSNFSKYALYTSSDQSSLF